MNHILLIAMISLPHDFSPAYLLPLCAAGLFLNSCSDDNPLSHKTGEESVRFNVEIGRGWNTDTRSGGPSPKMKSLTLTGGDSPLYLVPKTIEGISLSGRKQATRSSLTDNDNLESFGAFASIKPDGATSLDGITANYMSNVEVTKANNWSPIDRYMWPGKDALHFNAYSPFTASPGDSGITALPSATASGELTLSYSTPTDVADQTDLLVSTPVDSKSSPCDLSFNHALTAVQFAAGSEMAPCTVKSISISNVAADGVLNMETGKWSDLSATTSFTVSPEIVLTAAEGSNFVEAGSAITSEEQTFLLIPQTLPSDAEISITFDFKGEEKILTASLDGTTWDAGKTVVYRISANPSMDSFILQLTDADGNALSALTSNYTGSTLNFNVRSAFGDPADTAAQTNVAWKAEFVDDSGNVISRPDWISAWTMSGTGSTGVSATTTMQTPVFVSISKESQQLRDAADINTSSGYRPYNLANSTGQATPQNTANCYLIHAPGFYAIPLVYGNAITNGATYSLAYKATSTHNTRILPNLVNHLGAAITDPYIYNNANCVPEDAVLIWEERLNLIQKVQLSPDKKRLIFVVSPDFICQGNAVVAVRDASGTVLWSWHLWVTPYDPDTEDPHIVNYHGKNYELMQRNLGQITSGDKVNYAERTAKIRYTQIPDDGSDPLSLTVELTQKGKLIEVPSCYNFYQWGRKDPFVGDLPEWYTSGYNEVTHLWTKDSQTDRTPGLPMMSDFIRTPGYFWTNPHSNDNSTTSSSSLYETTKYVNLWNTNYSTTNEVKTIYDPSPAGFMVGRNVLTALIRQKGVVTNTDDFGIGVNVNIPDSDETIFFPCGGYRGSITGDTGKDYQKNVTGYVWSSYTISTTMAQTLIVTVSTDSVAGTSQPRHMGYGIKSTKVIK